MSDVRAAAERLRTYWNVNPDEREFSDGEVVHLYLEDLRVTSEAYLAEHDETPIDEEWLKSLGKTGRVFLDYADEDGWFFAIAADDHGIHCAGLEKTFKTRSDVRRLCTALGIQLKEPSRA
jgi:hypothetical protein